VSIEIPQTVKMSLRTRGRYVSTQSSTVTIVEISDPTAVGDTFELIDQHAVRLGLNNTPDGF